VQTGLGWTAGTSLVAHVPSGNTLLRIRFGWGFIGTTSDTVALHTVMLNAQVFGLCTVAPGHTPPNARTASSDVAPPLERWLWWEARVPQVSALSVTAGVVTWQDSPQSEPDDAKGQVAANVAGGSNLDVYASWAPGLGWDASGQADVWYWASVGYKTTL
jgi:hypothetical protein